jgi:hypothetical protein
VTDDPALDLLADLGLTVDDVDDKALDAIRARLTPAEAVDPVRSWVRNLLADPDAVTAPAADDPPPLTLHVRGEGGNAPHPGPDERTKFVRELFGYDPATGFYR